MKVNVFQLDIVAVVTLLFAAFLVPSESWHIRLTLMALVLWSLLAEGSILHALQDWLNRKVPGDGSSRMM